VFTLLFAMFGNLKDGLLVFSGIPFALDGRHRGAVAARHSDVDLGSGGLHCAVRRGGAQRAGDDLVHPQRCAKAGSRWTMPSEKAR
jgi:hypothetical protein